MKWHLLLAIIALSFLSVCFNSSASNTSDNETALLNLPDTRQSTEYSCGAAAMQAVLSYWGRDIGEEDLRELLNTNSESGTYPEDIVRVARELGLQSEFEENVTLDEINASLEEGVPVIIDCQAWRSPATKESWKDDWSDGHYMVIIGVDDQNVYFEDPYILGSRGFLSHQEFEERWHNPRGWWPEDDANQIHLGIFIRGDEPAEDKPLVHVD